MLAITRYRVDDVAGFGDRAAAALAVLSGKPGFVAADLNRNVDDPQLWVLVTRWADIGSYRRALGGYESKMVVVPLLSEAIDEPTAYELPELH